MEVAIVSLSEVSSFLVVGPVWINVDEISHMNLAATDAHGKGCVEIHAQSAEGSSGYGVWTWGGSEAEAIRTFLTELVGKQPWEKD